MEGSKRSLILYGERQEKADGTGWQRSTVRVTYLIAEEQGFHCLGQARPEAGVRKDRDIPVPVKPRWGQGREGQGTFPSSQGIN